MEGKFIEGGMGKPLLENDQKTINIPSDLFLDSGKVFWLSQCTPK